MKRLSCLLAILLLTATLPAAAKMATATWGQIKTLKISQQPQVQAAPRLIGSYLLSTIATPKGNTRYIVAEKYVRSAWWKFWEKPRIEVWARVRSNSCSYKDKLLMTIPGADSISKTKAALCELKGAYDTGKLGLSCGATTACAACLKTGAVGGIAAGVCIAACAYAIPGGGALDCIAGIISATMNSPSVILPPTLGEFGDWLIDQVCQ